MSDTPEDGTFLESYEELSRAELVEECKARGLKENGNKQLLIQRLEADDAAEASRADESEAESGEDVPEAPEMAAPESEAPDAPESPAKPAEVVSDQPSGHNIPPYLGQVVPSGDTYHAEFDLPAGYELLHEDLDMSWKLQARDAAIADGREPLGGAYAAHNIGFGSRDGKQTIIYRVPVKAG